MCLRWTALCKKIYIYIIRRVQIHIYPQKCFFFVFHISFSDYTCNHQLTISCATTSGTSFSRSNVNSMAPLSLYFPFNFLWSSTHSFRAIEAFFPSSSSASSTLTPVSSAKKAWFNRSLMLYLEERRYTLKTLAYICTTHTDATFL